MGYGTGKNRFDVAHKWAHQLEENYKNGAVFFEGKTIFSYGRHFPMARLLGDGKVAITTRTYSNTTSAHLSAVAQAVSHLDAIYCYDIPSYDDLKFDHDNNIAHYITEMEELLKGLAKARKPAPHVLNIEALRGRITKYITHFKVKLTAKQRKFLMETDLEKYKEVVKEQLQKDNKKREAAIKRAIPLHTQWLEAWRAGNEGVFAEKLNKHEKDAIEMVEYDGRTRNHVRLRVIGNKLHTSKRIKMPLAVAERFYRKYIKVVESGGCTPATTECNYSMLGFDVQEMTAEHILVGCHDIPRSEIDYVANQFGWWDAYLEKGYTYTEDTDA